MSKFKVGDMVTRTSESYGGAIKGKQYKVNKVSDHFGIQVLSLDGLVESLMFMAEKFELSPVTKDGIVSIELTHEQLLILYSLVASTTGNYVTETHFTLKRNLENIHGRKALIQGNLRLPTYVLNHDGSEKMKNFVKSFFPEPKSEQQLEYDKLQEQIRLLQQQAEKLNPSKGGGLWIKYFLS